MNSPEFPTPWQRKTIWIALTALAIVSIGAVAVGLIWLTSRVLGFLQPILIPFAVAGVLAYLLDPVVEKIVSWGTTRQRAVIAVFLVLSLIFAGILVWIVPAISTQTQNLIGKVPRYTERVKTMVIEFADNLKEKTGFELIPMLSGSQNVSADVLDDPAGSGITDPSAKPQGEGEPTGAAAPARVAIPGGEAEATPPEPVEKTEPPPPPAAEPEAEAKPATPEEAAVQYDLQQLLSGEWVRTSLPVVIRNSWNFIRTSVGGFLGVFGFLLSMIIVPVYLYYFLIESRNIATGWQNYVPLRASAFKDEVVSTLSEINGYLIAFFRGQLVVSLINGTATGLGLVLVGLDFGLLIGLGLCVLGLIPYLGIILCWIPAVIIAAVQGGSWMVPGEPWWLLPVIVTAIFTVVQQVDGLFITPRVVGESVGLHPMTVIVSVFVWSLLMGGLLGAILAVPMTATLKVLLKRFVWERKIMASSTLVVPGQTLQEQGVSSVGEANEVSLK